MTVTAAGPTTGTVYRRYTAEPGYTADFVAVRDFLVRINEPAVITPGFLWARWEYVFGHSMQDRDHLDRIGVWEVDGAVVALATYEMTLGEAYLVCDPARRDLLPEVVDHALTHLRDAEGRVRVVAPDRERDLQRVLLDRGLRATDHRETDTVLDLTGPLDTTPPPGYRCVSLAEEFDVERFHRLLWRGFDHEGEPPPGEEELEWRRRLVGGPSADQALNTLVVAEDAADGEYAAFCGVWHLPGSRYALVEPVCTDPDHRRRGAATAAVRTALAGCAARGATEAYVGANLPVYVAMGFAPVGCNTWWAERA